jgi:hypothetical protein
MFSALVPEPEANMAMCVFIFHSIISSLDKTTKIYKTAEDLLAHQTGTDTAVTVSSGMLAGKLALEQLLHTTEELFEKFTSNSFTEEELSSLHEKCKNIKGWDVQEEPYRHINPASKDNWLKDCPKKLREELDKLWQLD